MENQFSFKELYDVVLKATYDIEIAGRKYSAGEVVCAFDKVTLGTIDEIKKYTHAKGGFDNRSHVIWERTEQIPITLTQGVFSKIQFGMMNNGEISPIGPEELSISQREITESNEDGIIKLKRTPIGQVYVKDKESGEKVNYEIIDGTTLKIEGKYLDVVVDYNFIYNKGATRFRVGRVFTEGFLSLEGRTRTKDDITGHDKTGIIKIPRIKLMSELSISLGRNATPVTSKLQGFALPVGPKGAEHIMDFFFLENDIDADIE